MTTYDSDGNDVTRYACDDNGHLYSDWTCSNCGRSVCFACSVCVTDESRAKGVFTCPSCGHTGQYN